MGKRLLVVFDFDGLLVNSYAILRQTMASFGLDVGDELRFRNRRKFLKYLGGGRELLNNVVGFSLPKTRRLRERLTEYYVDAARAYPVFVPLLNEMIANPQVHCGVLSRNYALDPGPVIRAVLAHSGICERDLDFVIPLPVGVKKGEVLAGMRSARYLESLLAADEIGDYTAGTAAGYDCFMASYGFDARERLVAKGEVPPEQIYDDPETLAAALGERLAPYAPRPDGRSVARAAPSLRAASNGAR